MRKKKNYPLLFKILILQSLIFEKEKNNLIAAQKIESEINRYLATLSERKKKAVLAVVKSFTEQEEMDLGDELPDDVKASVLISRKQIKNRKYKTHSEVMKKYKTWVKK